RWQVGRGDRRPLPLARPTGPQPQSLRPVPPALARANPAGPRPRAVIAEQRCRSACWLAAAYTGQLRAGPAGPIIGAVIGAALYHYAVGRYLPTEAQIEAEAEAGWSRP